MNFATNQHIYFKNMIFACILYLSKIGRKYDWLTSNQTEGPTKERDIASVWAFNQTYIGWPLRLAGCANIMGLAFSA